jgi:hypothetical protein
MLIIARQRLPSLPLGSDAVHAHCDRAHREGGLRLAPARDPADPARATDISSQLPRAVTDNFTVHRVGPYDAIGVARLPLTPGTIELARTFAGSRTVDVAGLLGIDQWRADRWPNLMCACFVSAILRNAGYLAFDPNMHVYPADVEAVARATGWRPIEAGQAAAGDLAIMPFLGASGHVELVSRRHRSGLVLIGSNNIDGELNPQIIGEELVQDPTLARIRFYRAPA